MRMDVPVCGLPIDGDVAGFRRLQAMEAAIVRAVVRGDEPVSALKQTRLRFDTANPVIPPSLFEAIHLHDIAAGILALKDHPDALADWAGFILVMIGRCDFGDGLSEACDRLVTAIWNLSFGVPADAAMIRLAQSTAKA